MRSGTPRDRVEYRLQVQCAIAAPTAPLPTFDPTSCLRLQGSTGRRSNGRASIKSQPRLQLSGRVGQRSEKISCAHRGREPSAPAIGGCSRHRRRSPPQRGGGPSSILSLARSPLLHSACKCVAYSPSSPTTSSRQRRTATMPRSSAATPSTRRSRPTPTSSATWRTECDAGPDLIRNEWSGHGEQFAASPTPAHWVRTLRPAERWRVGERAEREGARAER